jgi:hypothetical protein
MPEFQPSNAAPIAAGLLVPWASQAAAGVTDPRGRRTPSWGFCGVADANPAAAACAARTRQRQQRPGHGQAACAPAAAPASG